MNASWLSCRVRSAIAEPSYAGLVVGPAAAHLDPRFQVDLAAEKLFHVEAGCGRDTLQLPAARSDDDRLVSFLFYHDRGVDAPQPPLFLELLDLHGAAVGELLAEQAKQLFANQLCRQKALVPVGQVVLAMDGRLLRQVALDDAHQLVEPLAPAGADRDDFGKFGLFGGLLEERQQTRRFARVDLVHDENERQPGRHEFEERAISGAEAFRFDHQHDDIDFIEGPAHSPIHRAVERVAVPRLETRGVDENELGGRGGAHAAKAMPGGLRLARGDAELVPQQRVEQRGFSDVGAPDQGDRAAAERLRDHRDAATQLRICAKARNAASCSAVRRLLPLPVVRTESSGIRHSTSKLSGCAPPRGSPPRNIAAARSFSPEATPAEASSGPSRAFWDPGLRGAARTAARWSPGPPRTRRRERSRRSALRAHRRESKAARIRRFSARPRPAAGDRPSPAFAPPDARPPRARGAHAAATGRPRAAHRNARTAPPRPRSSRHYRPETRGARCGARCDCGV